MQLLSTLSTLAILLTTTLAFEPQQQQWSPPHGGNFPGQYNSHPTATWSSHPTATQVWATQSVHWAQPTQTQSWSYGNGHNEHGQQYGQNEHEQQNGGEQEQRGGRAQWKRKVLAA